MRLRTLPLSMAGIGMGGALAARMCSINGYLFFFLILTAVLLQILSNLANDYGDFKKGTDLGHRSDRMMASGNIQESIMKRALILFMVLALISGILALNLAFPDAGGGFWLFLILGITAIAAAVNYTVGRRPYGYHGLGDVFVFIFFGLVAVLGSAFLLSGGMLAGWLAPAGIIGFLSVAVLHINNVRDREMDEKAGKRTLAVLLGNKPSILYQWLLYAFSLVLLFVFSMITDQRLLLLSAAIPVSQMMWWFKTTSSINPSIDDFNKMLKIQAIGTFIFSVLFSVLYLL